VPLSLFGDFMAGTAGHHSNLQISDYCIFAFIITTPIVLTVVKKLDNKATLLGRTLNLIAKLLVILGVIILLVGLFEQVQMYIKNSFTIGDMLTTLILLSLLVLSLLTLVGLIKNKV
jgi:hypothetical protein